MGPRIFLLICFAALAAASIVAVAAGTWLIAYNLPENAKDFTETVIVYGGGLAFLLAAAIAVLWAYLDMAMARPLATIVRGVQTVLHANPEHRIEIDDEHQLGGLPEAVKSLVGCVAEGRGTVNDAIAAATEQVEDQKAQLETILRDLHEGVVVCNLGHKILLYNHRALELLHVAGELGLDRSLFNFTNRQPFLHALSRLTNRLTEGRHREHPEGVSAPFVGSTTDDRHTLEGRMSLILNTEENPTGYVISFEDKTDELAALGTRDHLLRDAIEGLRGPVANIRAAAEILSGFPEMSTDERSSFETVVFNESARMSETLENLSTEYRKVITGHWPMSDLYSANLFNSIERRLREDKDVKAVMIGIPQWLHGDSYTLVELIDRLVHRVSENTGADSFELEAIAGERHIYMDVAWQGTTVSAADLTAWLKEELVGPLGGLTLRDVLDHHKTDVWSLTHRDGMARLRLPLPRPVRPPTHGEGRVRSARPEFYDFELLQRPAMLDELGSRPLKSLNYVVFDTETTGLQPSAGDEVISIAGVRIVNGRILTGESFQRLVDPGRVIPKESIRFHGITDEMVKDKPPIRLVLPQFREFVGDAVLIAHNAAFDLKFLKLREAEAGVTFDMPVLDTLLLSVYVHDHTPRHTLDAVAERFGIVVQGRHTAFGDALVTAGVFLKMLDVLAARGIETLDQAIEASNTIVEVRAKQASF